QRWGIRLARRFHCSWGANAISNIIGMSGLTGSGIRFMLLTRDGVPADRAAVYAGVHVLCIPLGLAVLAALALFIHGEMPASLALPDWAAMLVLAGVAGYLL